MKYDYWIEVKSIIPPLGNKKFYAIARIHEISKGKVDNDLGEVWGETKNEAEKKMRRKVEEWLKNK